MREKTEYKLKRKGNSKLKLPAAELRQYSLSSFKFSKPALHCRVLSLVTGLSQKI